MGKCLIRRKGRVPRYKGTFSEEAEMMAVLQRCKSSMMQVFTEQTVVSDLVEEDFMEAFLESPEYAEALEEFRKRFDADRGRG